MSTIKSSGRECAAPRKTQLPHGAEGGSRPAVVCPCGCGQPVRTPAGYGGRGCSLRAVPKDVRAARSRAWALANPEFMREIGRRTQGRIKARRWDDLLDQWLDDRVAPADALRTSYRRGYMSGYEAGMKKAGMRYRRSRAA
jgi:hypothetical protein